MSKSTSPILGRAVGAVQVLGGGLEIALGLGGVVMPEPATTVGGVILIAHGGDTVLAGFRSLITGEVQQSFTQQGASSAAEALGADPATAQRIGTGVDIAAGIGPGLGIAVSRRLAIASAEGATPRVAVAYLSRGSVGYGHNAVGVATQGKVAWFHYVTFPRDKASRFVPLQDAHLARGKYVITELAVGPAQAARASAAVTKLRAAGAGPWRLLPGPNCSTTALQVLRAAGIVVPEWSRSPMLLQWGVRFGGEITVVGGGSAATAAALGERG